MHELEHGEKVKKIRLDNWERSNNDLLASQLRKVEKCQKHEDKKK
jgi:hypothetical protein